MLQHHLPILGIRDDGLLMSDFSVSLFFRYSPLAMEGMTPWELRSCTDKGESLINLCPEEDIFIQFTTDIFQDTTSVLDRHVHTQRIHPLTRMAAERRRQQYGETMFWNNVLCVHVPFGPKDPKKKQAATQADFVERDRKIRSLSAFVVDHMANTLNLKIEPMTGAESWRTVFREINPFIPLDRIPEPVLPDRKNFITYPPVDLNDQLILSDRYDSTAAMQDIEGFYDVLTLNNLPPDFMNPMVVCSLLGRLDFAVRSSLSINLTSQKEATLSLERTSSFANIFSGKRKLSTVKNAEHVSGIRALFDDVAKSGTKLVRFGLNFTVWDRTADDLRRKVSQLQTAIGAVMKNALFFREIYQRPRAYVGGLAGFPQKNLRWRWGNSKTAANMTALLGPLGGTTESPRMLFGNRWNSVTCLDVFSERMNRWAFAIIAPTGSGKSVLANYLIQSALSSTPAPFVVVFDMATMPSYRPLMDAFGGQSVDLSYNSEQSANIFDFRLGFDKPPQDHLAFVEETLSAMLAERKHFWISKEDESILRRAIYRMYERTLVEAPKKIEKSAKTASQDLEPYGTWVEARDAFLAKAEECSGAGDDLGVKRYLDLALSAHRDAMPLLGDLAATLSQDQVVLATNHDREIAPRLRRMLDAYIEGPAAKLFNSKTHLRLDKNLTCINMGLVKDRQEHLAALFMILRRHIWMESVYFDEGIPERMVRILGLEHYMRLQQRMKLVLYDEFHNFRQNAAILRMIDKDARQQRTLGMAWGIITQSLSDLVYESEEFQVNLGTSVASKFLLRHSSPDNPQEMEVKYVKEKLGLNDSETEILSSLVLAPGHYSEIMVFAEGVGRGVVRLSLQPQELWLYTTHKNERYVRDALVKAIMARTDANRTDALPQAVAILSERYPNGIREWDSEKISLDELVNESLNLAAAGKGLFVCEQAA